MIETYGGPDVVRIRRDISIPLPGPNEVQVRVSCVGINFMKIHTRQEKCRDSRTYPVTLPCTLGMEGAGTVVVHTLLNPSIGWLRKANVAAPEKRLGAFCLHGISANFAGLAAGGLTIIF